MRGLHSCTTCHNMSSVDVTLWATVLFLFSRHVDALQDKRDVHAETSLTSLISSKDWCCWLHGLCSTMGCKSGPRLESRTGHARPHLEIPSGKRLHSYWKWPLLIFPLNIVIFHSYVSLPEGISNISSNTLHPALYRYSRSAFLPAELARLLLSAPWARIGIRVDACRCWLC